MICGGGKKVSSREGQSLESEGKLCRQNLGCSNDPSISYLVCVILCSHFLLNGDENLIDGHDYLNIISMLYNINILSYKENLLWI